LTVRDAVGSNFKDLIIVVNDAPNVTVTSLILRNTPNGCLSARVTGSATSPDGFPGEGFTWSWSFNPAAPFTFPSTQQTSIVQFIAKRTEGYDVTATATEVNTPSDRASRSMTVSIAFDAENAGHQLYHSGIPNVTTGPCVLCHKAGTHDTTVGPFPSAADLKGKSSSAILDWLNLTVHSGRTKNTNGTDVPVSSRPTGLANSTLTNNLAAFFATVGDGCGIEKGTEAGH
jgi:hypothetical protein